MVRNPFILLKLEKKSQNGQLKLNIHHITILSALTGIEGAGELVWMTLVVNTSKTKQ